MLHGNLHWKSALIAVVLLCLMLATAIFSGIASKANINIHTLLMGAKQSSLNDFVIVEIQGTPDELLATIHQSQPKRVFWTLPDEPLTEEVRDLIAQYNVQTIKVPSVTFDSRGNLTSKSKSPWQPSAGYLIPVTTDNGIARTIPWRSQDQDNLPAPAAALHSLESNADPDTFYLDYSSVSFNSPVLTHDLATDVKLVSETTKGRDIFLTDNISLQQTTISTPFSSGKIGWLPVQFHAAALQAYENNRFFVLPSTLSTISVCLLFSAVIIIVFVAVTPKLKSLLSVSMAIIALGIIVSVHAYMGIIAPTFELLLCTGVLWIFIRRHFSTARTNFLHQLNDRLGQEVAYLSFKGHQNEKFWENVSNLVSQSLLLEKSIFLKLDKKQHHLTEIAALNCSFEDIDEQRRDINREPYSQVLNAKQAMECARTFFKHKAENEQEILAPLCKGSEVLGFWALTTTEPNGDRRQQLTEYVDLFAMQISSLLHIQNTTESALERRQSFTKRFGDNDQILFHLAQQKLDMLFSTEHAYNSLFKSMATPALMFDVFGRVSMHNSAMAKLAKLTGLALHNVNALEFLQQVLDEDANVLKTTIRQLTIEHSHTEQRYFVNLEEQKYIVILTSVHKDQELVAGQEFHVQLSGVLCEFHSLKDVQSYLQTERSLYDNYVIKIKNHLSTLQMGLMQIESKAEVPLISQLSFYLTQELKSAAEITRRTHYFMNRVQDKNKSNVIPFNPLQILQSVIRSTETSVKENALWRDVTYDINIPNFSTLGLGNPEIFHHVILSALRLLADDAVAPKNIHIFAKQMHRNDVDILYLKIDSEGYGLPNEQLQQLIEHHIALGEKTFLTTLLSNIKEAVAVNMDCRLKSKVGKGYRLSMILEGISLDE